MAVSMNTTSHLFESSFGWVITVPAEWVCLFDEPIQERVGQPPPSSVTFLPSTNSSVALTWMYTARPVPERASNAFIRDTVTPGPRNVQEAAALMTAIYPMLGSVVAARVIVLQDSTRALELVEEFVQEATGEKKKSYQLLFPIHGRPTAPVRFQRLCFYAPVELFDTLIADVAASARSFHYRRPFRFSSSSE